MHHLGAANRTPTLFSFHAVNFDGTRFGYRSRGYLKDGEAADYLVREGAKSVMMFKSKNPQSFWKSNGNIFVIDCEQGKTLANANLAIAGAPLQRSTIRSASILRNHFAKMVAGHMAVFEAYQPKPEHNKGRSQDALYLAGSRNDIPSWIRDLR